MFNFFVADRRHLNTKCHSNSENDCEPYNTQFIELACLVCTVKYRTSLLVRTKKPQSDISGTDLTLGQYSFIISQPEIWKQSNLYFRRSFIIWIEPEFFRVFMLRPPGY